MHNLLRNNTEGDSREGILVLEVSHRAQEPVTGSPDSFSRRMFPPSPTPPTYKISSIFSTFGTGASQRVFTPHRARPFRRDLSRRIIGIPEIPYHYPARSRSRFVRARTRRIYNRRISSGLSIVTNYPRFCVRGSIPASRVPLAVCLARCGPRTSL